MANYQRSEPLSNKPIYGIIFLSNSLKMINLIPHRVSLLGLHFWSNVIQFIFCVLVDTKYKSTIPFYFQQNYNTSFENKTRINLIKV